MGRVITTEHRQTYRDGKKRTDKVEITIWEDSIVRREIFDLDVDDIPNVIEALKEKYEQIIDVEGVGSKREEHLRKGFGFLWR